MPPKTVYTHHLHAHNIKYIGINIARWNMNVYPVHTPFM